MKGDAMLYKAPTCCKDGQHRAFQHLPQEQHADARCAAHAVQIVHEAGTHVETWQQPACSITGPLALHKLEAELLTRNRTTCCCDDEMSVEADLSSSFDYTPEDNLDRTRPAMTGDRWAEVLRSVDLHNALTVRACCEPVARVCSSESFLFCAVSATQRWTHACAADQRLMHTLFGSKHESMLLQRCHVSRLACSRKCSACRTMCTSTHSSQTAYLASH